MILMKAIKPKPLKSAAFRMYLINEMRTCAKEIQADFAKTTETWEHKPKFEQIVAVKPYGPELLVGTSDLIYRFVDEGTKKHLIWAGIYTGKSNKKALAFPGTFTPKTMPGVIGSSAGESGGETVVVPYVEHPGTKPRKFDETIRKTWEPKFKRRMEEAMRRAVKASGHKI